MDDTAARIRLTEVAACMCVPGADGAACSSEQAGHALLAIQERVAAAAPSGWRDGIVTGLLAGGWVQITALDGAQARVWNHDAADLVSLGEPVAVHPTAGVLAAGGRRVSARLGA